MSRKNKIARYEITESMFNETVDTYFLWKKLNQSCEKIRGRKNNIPEVVSENICCYLLRYERNEGDAGDATDKNKNKIEIKAASVEKDLSSFGPVETFDNLIFMHFKVQEDKVNIYNLNMNYDDIGSLPCSKTKTVKQTRDEGKRPHFSLMETVITPKNIKPTIVYDLANKKIISETA